MRFLFVLLLIFGSIDAVAKMRTVTVKSKSKPKHRVSYKMSEKARKALAKRQVAHARYIASLRKKEEEKPPEIKINDEVTIKDFGFEEPTKTPEPTPDQANVTSENIGIEDGYAPEDR